MSIGYVGKSLSPWWCKASAMEIRGKNPIGNGSKSLGKTQQITPELNLGEHQRQRTRGGSTLL
jgi:hypothetical protein